MQRKIRKGNRFVVSRRVVYEQLTGVAGKPVVGYTQWSIWDRVEKKWLKYGPRMEMMAEVSMMNATAKKVA
jgi:hypothetical protein